MVVKPGSPLFGKVNVYDPRNGRRRVEIYVRIEQRIENMKVGIAIDASASMQPNFAANIPKAFRQPGQNMMEPVVRGFTRFLCQLSGDGTTRVIYWAVGPGGREIEIVGDIDSESAPSFPVEGPVQKAWGGDTHLLPVIDYFAKEYHDSRWLFLLVITDGELRDLEEVENYCMAIGAEMAEGQRQNCKFVIVGVGHSVNIDQLEALDDMFDGSHLEKTVDLWDHKIASEISDLSEILDEVDFGVRIPGAVRIIDDAHTEVLAYTDGFPHKLEFSVDESVRQLSVFIAGQTIIQPLE